MAVALMAATVATSTGAARSTVESSTPGVTPSINLGPAPTRAPGLEAVPAADPVRRPVEGTRFLPVVPQQAEGTFAVAPAQGGSSGPADLTYVVEVERGLPYSAADVATQVDAVLGDERGWTGVVGTTFDRVEATADLRVRLASPDTTDRLCAPLLTRGQVSCRNGDLVVLNAVRWAVGVPHYGGRVADYRRYVVNHEVGHALGQGHVSCPSPGAPAPVMVQQTYGLQGCRPNPWPAVG